VLDAPVVAAIVTPVAYVTAVALAAVAGVAACAAARRRPGRWRPWVAGVLGAALLADAVSYVVALVVAGTFTARTDLPLALCNVAVLVAAAACFWRVPVLVELTWFWGLAGTLQAIVTPDLDVGFPHVVFFQYMVGHLGIVLAALFLVVGMGLRPRPGAALRVLGITALYTGFVGLVDGLSGANYMFLRSPPANWTLLRVLGPWPWYTVSAAGVAVVLVTALDAPFWAGRRALKPSHPPRTSRLRGAARPAH
jgi:hypothetical integral membrane protein (TIGR02206 family)